MAMPDLEGTLHVTNNGSTAGLLRQAFHLGRRVLLESEDPLDCGPMPATSDLEEWRTIREGFLKFINFDWPEFAFAEFADTGLFMNIGRLLEADQVMIWAGLSLSEQLLIAWVITLFKHLDGDASKLRIVQFEKERDDREVYSIGLLHPETIKAFCPMPRTLSGADLAELRRIWQVYTSPDPTLLDAYVNSTRPLPIAHNAVRKLVNRYPDHRTGLSIWDNYLLRFTGRQGPKAARVIGHAMACGWGLDQPGDNYLFYRLVRLGTMSSPLVSLSGDTSNMRNCGVELTKVGERVLAGEINNVEENGIDDWIGGVHLNDREPVTFRDGDSLLLN